MFIFSNLTFHLIDINRQNRGPVLTMPTPNIRNVLQLSFENQIILSYSNIRVRERETKEVSYLRIRFYKEEPDYKYLRT